MVDSKRRPGPKRALTERGILDAALALLDAGGPTAASIRRIAAAVGVAPNAVYTYFPDKASVESALVERLLGEVDEAITLVRPAAASWRAEVEGLTLDLRRRLLAHPGVVPLLLGKPVDGPQAQLLGERLRGFLAEGGLSTRMAARGAYVVMAYVLGSIACETADLRQAGALSPEPERIGGRPKARAERSDAELPRPAATAGVTAASIGTDQFLWGLRRVLDGLVRASQGRGSAP
jgi:AcrR family transcriptional regulator